jgi:hypothetical protein
MASILIWKFEFGPAIFWSVILAFLHYKKILNIGDVERRK